MTPETQDLVSWPRDLRGKLRLACEGTDSPTGLYPPLDRANLPRWVWCVLTWSMAAASLALVSYSELALLGFFIVLPMIWWVYTKWWTAVVGHLIFGAGFAAAGYLRGDEAWWVNSIIMVVVVLVTGTWVTWVHIVRYEAIHALADKERALAALARTQDELVVAERAAGIAAEHERWSREVHDTLAQGFISVITLAQAARGELDSGEIGMVIRRLDQLEAVGRDNLAESRALVAGEGPSALKDGDLAQALRRLVDAQRERGLSAVLDLSLSAEPSPAAQVAVLRIVQEGLSNARRHAGAPGRVEVRVDRGPEDLVVEVLDDGDGPSTPADSSEPSPGSPGHGLVGMRERVASHGGTLETGPRSGGGFRVRAVLPIRSGEP